MLEVIGPEEVVFEWADDQCEPEHIPDIAARAIRDANDRVQLTIGHYVNYRMIGLSLDELTVDCTPLLVSDFDADPAQFNDSAWLGGLHTTDGETIYAIVHNEYRGDTHDAARPGQCPSSDRFTCLDTSHTLYVSRDGGDSYEPIRPPPGHLVASLPYVFDDEGLPTGLRQPSNLVDGRDGFVYLFSNVSDYPNQDQWVCAMRTDDLEDPASWRYWTGTDFTGRFVNPYLVEADGTEKCAPLALPELDVTLQESVVYDEVLGRFVMIGSSQEPGTGERWGVYFSTSEDLIEWTPRQLVLELPSYPSVTDPEVDFFYAYASLIDPDSPSRNFDTSDGTAYVYITRFNAGTSSLDRDLVRWPVQTRLVEIERPDWDFETDGDTEGWTALNHATGFTARGGSLIMESTADDLYFGTATNIPAQFDRITIRMRVSGGTPADIGQLFFGTDSRPDYTEETSVIFAIDTDGEVSDYTLNLSDNEFWTGTITSLRLDPGTQAGQVVEIERIWFP